MIRTDKGNEYSVEELVGSILFYCKQIAEAYSGTQIRDAVLVVPAFFGQEQRSALLQASKLSGLEVMTMVNSHAAAALQYGITRDFSSEPQHVVLYDVGYDSVEAALVHYSTYELKKETQNQFEVKDVVWDDNVGGRDMDVVLMEHFAAEFKEKFNSDDILKSPKAVAKLRKQVKRTKEILSANQEAPFNVEELYDDKDFSSSITRAKFEELIAPIVEKIKQPLINLLNRNELKLDDISAFELIGGTSRVPIVQQVLSETLKGRALDKHLDADEAVVLGAGLVAANLSSTFRLRKFGMADGAIYPISVTLIPPENENKGDASDDNTFKPKTLLPFMKRLEAKRVLSFSNITTDPLKVQLAYEDVESGLPPGVSKPQFVTYTVSGLSSIEQKHGYTGKVAFHFFADASGIVTLNKADATVNVTQIQTKMVPVNVTEGEQTEQESSNKSEDAVDSSEQKEVESETTENETADEQNTTETEEKAKTKMEKVEYEVTKAVKIPLNITNVEWGFEPLSEEEIQTSQTKLQRMSELEDEKRANAKAKNELESYIYEMRDKIADEDITFYKVSTSEWRDNFSKKLLEMEDWLMYEGEGESAPQYKDKLKLLKKESDPVTLRAFEFDHRDKAVEELKNVINLIKISTVAWPDVKPWMNQTDIDALVKQADTVQEWLDGKLSEQEKLQIYEDPIIKITELTTKMGQLMKQFNKLNNKKPPRLPPPQKSTNDTNTTEGEQNKTTNKEEEIVVQEKEQEKHEEL
eukprot:TRINITY_DN8114_c0_g4_i1.p1 TRINITY_DN8114_c0_g4~~TRINITY_DN8114_c0_g4_i1.p1  ORF type:complete len:882 (-),score=199.14 TRINITY_DN8114_c0_g4_i1:153-2411(-)